MFVYAIEAAGEHEYKLLGHHESSIPVAIGAVFVLNDIQAEQWSMRAGIAIVSNRWRVSEMVIEDDVVSLIVTPIAEVTG